MSIFRSVRTSRAALGLRTSKSQAGFSLVEVSIVTAIVLIISIIGIPAINAYVVENKVPKVAGELQRYVARTKANGQGSSTPYAELTTENLARALRNSSVLSVDTGEPPIVAHGLGGDGTATGLVKVDNTNGGVSFTITMDAVNDAACPALSSMMQRVAQRIEITGSATAVVKDSQAATIKAYSPINAEEACGTGDTNRFVFTVW
nr:prepilin-type N-terminal cleavage/methylation domain-containing protein [Pseudomonas sp.]